MRVNSGGKVIVGSSESVCQINKKVTITFTGDFTTASDIGADPFDGSKK